MKMMNPYLTFSGQCEEAFEFYKSVFGVEFGMISRFKDVPQDAGMEMDPADAERIMHVSLPLGQGTILMGSDGPTAMGDARPGNMISVSLHPDSEEEADKLFAGLSEGGTVTMPMSKTFWNAYFGMCTDKFGINWMINYDYTTDQ